MSEKDPQYMSGAVRNPQAWQFMLRGVSEGMSRNDILGTLRDVGWGYRTQNFNKDYRDIAAITKGLSKVMTAGDDTVLGPGYVSQSPYPRDNEFTYIGGAVSYNPQTGVYDVQHMSFGSQSEMTAGDIRAEFEAMAEGDQYVATGLIYSDVWIGSAEYSAR